MMHEVPTMGEIILMINDVGEEERNRIREMYKKENDDPPIDGYRHRVITGVAVNALRGIIQNGGTPEDVKMALDHLIVCMDAKKYNLDNRQSYHDHKICWLLEKYGMKRP